MSMDMDCSENTMSSVLARGGSGKQLKVSVAFGTERDSNVPSVPPHTQHLKCVKLVQPPQAQNQDVGTKDTMVQPVFSIAHENPMKAVLELATIAVEAATTSGVPTALLTVKTEGVDSVHAQSPRSDPMDVESDPSDMATEKEAISVEERSVAKACNHPTSGTKRAVPGSPRGRSYMRPTKSSSLKIRRSRSMTNRSRQSKPKKARSTASSFLARLAEPRSLQSRIGQERALPTEEIKLQRVIAERKRAALEQQKGREFYEKSKDQPAPLLAGKVYGTQQLTIPSSPNLAASCRPRARSRSVSRSHESLFSSKAAAPKDSAPRPTVVQPFSFSTQGRCESRGETDCPSTTYRSNAQQIHDFQNKVPQRFHSKPTNNTTRPDLPSPCSKNLTEPQTFELRTKGIKKRPPPKSQVERDEEMIRNRKPFRARAWDPRVKDSMGLTGVPKVVKKPRTKPQEMNLRTKKRATLSFMKRAEKEGAKKKRSSRSRRSSMQRAALATKPVEIIPAKSEKKLCQPQSPKLHTKDRASVHPTSAPPPPPNSTMFKARPVPATMGRPPQLPKITEKQLCEPHTPQLESIRRHRQFTAVEACKNAERQQAEESRRLFHSCPVPDYSKLSKVGVGAVQATRLSVPQEPALNCIARHKQSQQALENQRLERAKKERKQHEFHARPLKHSKPFQVKKQVASKTTLISSPQNSKNASRKHEARKEKRAVREQQAAAQQEAAKAAKKIKEDEEIKQMRKSMVHTARSIGCDFSKPSAMPKPSQQTLTVPHSPKFRTDARANRTASASDQ